MAFPAVLPPGSNFYDLIMNITKEHSQDLNAPVSCAISIRELVSRVPKDSYPLIL